ncbi:MAG: glycosyltransferase family 1 protein [Chloroflexi bacterium]|nr:MAG: glycosyltransferase family 1 protein [Chloroflexota bacterium]
MKILFCNYEYPPLGGGGGVINSLLAQELAKQHEITVLTSQGSDTPPEIFENGVRVIRVPVLGRRDKTTASMLSMFSYIPLAVAAGKKLLMKDRFDVINTHFVLPTGPVGDALSSFAGIPNVLSLHGGDLYDPSKITSPHRHAVLRNWIRWLLFRADLVVGQSRNTLLNLGIFYAPEIDAIKIPLGIQKGNQIEKAKRQDFGCKADDIVLVTASRLVRRKAIHQLLLMMSILKNYKVKLIVIGDGPEAGNLKAETKRRGLENKVHFTGFISDEQKNQILNMADIYVSTTQHEGFCLSFLEAMMSGLPIVTYDNGGHTDYLKDKVNGFLVPLNDLDLFIDRCKTLVRDASLRARILENNRKLVQDYYIETCAQRYEEVFSAALCTKTSKSIVNPGALSVRPATKQTR